MAALTCEICGGKLIGRPGGIFECDSCGMEYDTAWAKEKIQEIKGTVKVEGTVEVQGTVKIDGPVKVEGTANAESFLKRAKMYIAEKAFDKADEYVEKALDNDPEYAEAYVCKLLIRLKKPSLEQAFDSESRIRFCTNMPEWQKAISFATGAYKTELEQFVAERKAYWSRANTDVVTRHQEIAPAQNMLFAHSGYLLALDMDGQTHVTPVGEYDDWAVEADGWTNILQIVALDQLIIGLHYDGTISCVTLPNEDLTDVADRISSWKNIQKIHAISRGHADAQVVGLTSDGRLMGARTPKDYLATYCRATDWNDIQEIAILYMLKNVRIGKDLEPGDHTSFVVGVTHDGNLKTTLPKDVKMYDFRTNPLECIPQSGIKKILVSNDGRHIEALEKAELAPGKNQMLDLVLSGTYIRKLTSNGVARIGPFVEERDLVAVNDYIGLKADGSVWVARDKEKDCVEIDEWRDKKVVAVAYHYNWAAAITENGSVLLHALDHSSQEELSFANVADWKLFDSLENLKKAKDSIAAKRKAAEKAAAEQQQVEAERQRSRREELFIQKMAVEGELNQTPIVFPKQRKMLKQRLAKIEEELKGL